jgi:hypothetical protein
MLIYTILFDLFITSNTKSFEEKFTLLAARVIFACPFSPFLTKKVYFWANLAIEHGKSKKDFSNFKK